MSKDEKGNYEENLTQKAFQIQSERFRNADAEAKYRISLLGVAAQLKTVKNSEDLIKEANTLSQWVMEPINNIPKVDDIRKGLIEESKKSNRLKKA